MNDIRSGLRQLRDLKNQIHADHGWREATREILLTQFRNASSPSQEFRWGKYMRELFQWSGIAEIGPLVKKPAMITFSLIGLALGGSMYSVSAAERSLPGDFFYGLKLVTEQARLVLTPTTQEKLKLKTEFTGRRVTELQQIAGKPEERQKKKVVEVAEILKRDLSTMKQQLNEVTREGSIDTVIAAARLVDQKTNEVIGALKETKDRLPLETHEKVTEVQFAAADAGVKAIEVLAEKQQEAGDQLPVTEIAQAIQDHTKTVEDATIGQLSSSGASSSFIAVTSTLPAFHVSSTEITSSTLPDIVNQMKDLTVQAFTMQKAKEQLESVIAGIPQTSTTTVNGGDPTSTGVLPPFQSTSTTSSSLPIESGGSNTGATSAVP